MYSMTSVGYGQRFPKSPQGKGVAILAAIFGAFYMAMPLTIIGSTFYEIYVEQEESRQKQYMKKRLRKAAFSIAKRSSFFRVDNENVQIDSGFSHLSKSLTMRPEDAAIVDKFIHLERNDIHQMDTIEKIKQFKQLHLECIQVLSLYLHEENSHEVARQHLHLARSVSGGDHAITLTAFKHASSHFGADDVENDILASKKI